MRTIAYISRQSWGGFGLVIWGGRRNGVMRSRSSRHPSSYGWPNPPAAAFAAVWEGRADEVWYDGKRLW